MGDDIIRCERCDRTPCKLRLNTTIGLRAYLCDECESKLCPKCGIRDGYERGNDSEDVCDVCYDTRPFWEDECRSVAERLAMCARSKGENAIVHSHDDVEVRVTPHCLPFYVCVYTDRPLYRLTLSTGEGFKSDDPEAVIAFILNNV